MERERRKWKQQIAACPSCCLHLPSLIVQPGWINGYLLYSDGQHLYRCVCVCKSEGSGGPVCFSELFFCVPTVRQLNAGVLVLLWMSLTGRERWGQASDMRTFFTSRCSFKGLLQGEEWGFSVKIRIKIRYGFDKDWIKVSSRLRWV